MADVAIFRLDDRALSSLFLDDNFLAHERNEHVLAVRAGIGRQDLEAHGGVLGAADLVDDVVESPAEHVGHLPGFALADADDAVADLDLARQ